MADSVDMRELFAGFILHERMRYDIHDNNRFAISLGKVQRNHVFLHIIKDRYVRLTQQLSDLEVEMSQFIAPLLAAQPRGFAETSKELQELSRQIEKTATELHLEIETFYYVGKTLIDH